MADLGGFQRFSLKPPFATTAHISQLSIFVFFASIFAFFASSARERALALPYRYSAYITYNSTGTHHSCACIINWVVLQNSRDMLPPWQNPRSATDTSHLSIMTTIHETIYALQDNLSLYYLILDNPNTTDIDSRTTRTNNLVTTEESVSNVRSRD